MDLAAFLNYIESIVQADGTDACDWTIHFESPNDDYSYAVKTFHIDPDNQTINLLSTD